MKKFLVFILLTFSFIPTFSREIDSQDNIFPIFGDIVREKGYELPKPMGVNIIYVAILQRVDINSLYLSKGKLNLENMSKILSVDVKKAKTSNKSKLLRADLWVFPFLNLYGLIGQTQGNTSAKLDIKIFNINYPYNLNVHYKEITYGGGITLAGGYKNFFSLIDFNYTKTSLKIIKGDVTSLIISPRVGYQFDIGDVKTAFWIGGMFQNIKETLSGDLDKVIDFPIKDIKFKVKESSSLPWSTNFGMRIQLKQSIEIMGEIGIGKGKISTFSVGYRF